MQMQHTKVIKGDEAAARWRNDRGSVIVVGAVVLPVLLLIGSLAIELGNVYLAKERNQQIADVAALAGALSGGPTNDATAVSNAASNVAQTNGLPSLAVSASLVASPSGDGNNAALVTITTAVPVRLAAVLGFGTSMNVSSSAWAEIKTAGEACIIGLIGDGTSYTQSGGSNVRANNCSIESGNNISVTGGSSLTAANVAAGGTIQVNGGSSIATTPIANNTQSHVSGIGDPVANNAALSVAFSGLANLSGSVANPATPAGGVSLAFAWAPSGPSDPTYPYYSGTGGIYNKGTLPCTGGSYALGTITVAGGVSVSINVTPGCTYTVTNGINNSGVQLVLAGTAGNWLVNGGITTGSTSIVFGPANSFWIGGGINVGGSGSLTFGAASLVWINGGITQSGGSSTNFNANSYQIAGTASLAGMVNWATNDVNPSINFYNGLTLNFGTYNFGAGDYGVNGGVFVGNGATVYIGNAMLSINGNLSISSGASLCGAPAPCGSGTSTLTIIDNGTNTINGGSTTNIEAPGSLSAYGVPGIAIASNYSSGAGNFVQNFSGGTGGTYGGVIYFPNSSLLVSGGTSASGPNCMEIVANVVQITGGSTVATSCSGFGGSIGSTTATLVQ